MKTALTPCLELLGKKSLPFPGHDHNSSNNHRSYSGVRHSPFSFSLLCQNRILCHSVFLSVLSNPFLCVWRNRNNEEIAIFPKISFGKLLQINGIFFILWNCHLNLLLICASPSPFRCSHAFDISRDELNNLGTGRRQGRAALCLTQWCQLVWVRTMTKLQLRHFCGWSRC